MIRFLAIYVHDCYILLFKYDCKTVTVCFLCPPLEEGGYIALRMSVSQYVDLPQLVKSTNRERLNP